MCFRGAESDSPIDSGISHRIGDVGDGEHGYGRGFCTEFFSSLSALNSDAYPMRDWGFDCNSRFRPILYSPSGIPFLYLLTIARKAPF